jgi:hypothetical protein
MEWLSACISATLFAQGGLPAPATTPSAVTTAPSAVVMSDPVWKTSADCGACLNDCCDRKAFQSDHCFDGFIGPITTPVYSKDPRSLTELRGLYVHNWIPGDNLLGGGEFDVYAIQARIALTERLTFIADKDGWLSVRPNNAAIGKRSGWLNLGLGLKYTFLRDVESQTIAAAGVMYEVPSGEEEVFQGRGNGIITPFLTYGKEFGDCWHFIGNVAHSTAIDDRVNSSFLFTQIHLDKGFNGWLYPLVEVNWLYYTQGGDSFPNALGEGDGLLSFGTQGVAGTHRVSIAAGLKAKVRKNIEIGGAYERLVTGGNGILDDRIVGEVILRY